MLRFEEAPVMQISASAAVLLIYRTRHEEATCTTRVIGLGVEKLMGEPGFINAALIDPLIPSIPH